MLPIDKKTVFIIAITVVLSTVIGHFVQRYLDKRWPAE